MITFIMTHILWPDLDSKFWNDQEMADGESPGGHMVGVRCTDPVGEEGAEQRAL